MLERDARIQLVEEGLFSGKAPIILSLIAGAILLIIIFGALGAKTEAQSRYCVRYYNGRVDCWQGSPSVPASYSPPSLTPYAACKDIYGTWRNGGCYFKRVRNVCQWVVVSENWPRPPHVKYQCRKVTDWKFLFD